MKGGGRFRIVCAPMWLTSACVPCRCTKCRHFRLRFVRPCAIQYTIEGDGAQSFRNRRYGRTAMPVREAIPIREGGNSPFGSSPFGLTPPPLRGGPPASVPRVARPSGGVPPSLCRGSHGTGRRRTNPERSDAAAVVVWPTSMDLSAENCRSSERLAG